MREIYCELKGTPGGFLGRKLKVEVDYGDRTEFLADKETGKKIICTSMVEALNLMAEEGWIYTDHYIVTVKHPYVHHYIMRKTIEE